MKNSSLRWQPFILSLLIGSTCAVLGWSIFQGWGGEQTFMPHAHCYFFNEQLIRLHGFSDFAIGVAYVSISATLTYLVLRARRTIPFHWMMLAFATFIVACGATHFMEVWTLRTPHPPYWAAGELKLVTAFASVATAFLLPPLVPKILRLLEEARLSSERKLSLETALGDLHLAHQKVTQLDQLKTNFFANISHELRTPITLILGPVNNLLSGKGVDADQRRELQLVKRNATLLHKHVNDLLDIARLEAGKMQVRYSRFDLVKLVRLVGSFFSSSSLRALDLDIEAPAELLIEADAEKLQGALFNLVSNAYKFTPENGKVRMVLREDGDDILIEVQDTGPGISPELREKIFERFNQGDTPTARGGAGTGLGLSIVREFVEMHAGQVSIGEAPGGGALFRIRLPRLAPEGARVTLEAAPAALPTVPGEEMARATLGIDRPSPPASRPVGAENSPLILVVEDHPDMSEHIVQSLSSEWRVATAPNGQAALDLIPDLRPDLIVTDLMMPTMNGEQLLDRLRAHPQTSSLPVILLTARADEEIKVKLLQSGAQDFLVKPFAAEELRTRVRNQLTNQAVRATLQHELASQDQDLARLAKEVTLRARDLERAKESAEAANRAKDQFLAVLSHELRTPLTPALAVAMNLEHQESLTPEELRNSLQVIRRNIELEAKLIDDLLDLTRIARGKLQLSLGVVDAHEAIQHAVEMCQSELLGKGSKLAVALEAEHHHLRADAPRLLQIVWNLLLNAVKFTPAEGGIRLRTFNEGRQFIIEVSDNGVGIAPEALRKIFEPFEQGGHPEARRLGGLGLGLAVAKGLVEAHGGKINVLSEGLGKGATFTIALETIVPGKGGADVSAETDNAAGARAVLRVLLVEDHEDTRDAMVRLLRRWGHEVIVASTVKGALEEVARGGFDLLVSDLGLPDGHGTAIMEALQKRSPHFIGIAMSGFGMEEDVRRSGSSGFAEHLTKPIGAQRLQAMIEKYAPAAKEAARVAATEL